MPEKQPFQKSVKQSFLGVINGVTIDDKLDYDHVDLILANQITNHVRELIEHKFEYATFNEFRFCYNPQLKSCFDHVDELIEVKA